MNIVVLLAAGESSRATGLKQLYKVAGEYLINRQIEQILSYGYEVVVVLGYASQQIASCINKDVKTIENSNYHEGMFSSVKRAFELLDSKRLIFCHIDRPLAKKELFEKLLKTESPIATASYQGKNAPPIMIQYSMKEALLASKATRLDWWIESTKKVVRFESDDARLLHNANTDEELRRYFA